MKKVLELFLELLFPPKCPFCGSLLKKPEKHLCGLCKRTLSFTEEKTASQTFPNIDICLSPMFYENKVRESLLNYKFNNKASNCKAYAWIIYRSFKDKIGETDIITWVPLSKKRLKKRGYDQAWLIADELSKITGVKCVKLLEKIIDTTPQSASGAKESRQKNISGAYRIVKGSQISGRNIALVDDIVTTGSTLSECGFVLKKSGARYITALTLARSCEN